MWVMSRKVLRKIRSSLSSRYGRSQSCLNSVKRLSISYRPKFIEPMFSEASSGLNCITGCRRSSTPMVGAHELGEMNFKGGHVEAHASRQPLGMELGFVTEDVSKAHARALAEGASELSAPSTKPWGQVVSYVRCPDGTLVELCTPIQN